MFGFFSTFLNTMQHSEDVDIYIELYPLSGTILKDSCEENLHSEKNAREWIWSYILQNM